MIPWDKLEGCWRISLFILFPKFPLFFTGLLVLLVIHGGFWHADMPR
jgi:hypothetical protein